jgi:hypothetical protein
VPSFRCNTTALSWQTGSWLPASPAEWHTVLAAELTTILSLSVCTILISTFYYERLSL